MINFGDGKQNYQHKEHLLNYRRTHRGTVTETFQFIVKYPPKSGHLSGKGEVNNLKFVVVQRLQGIDIGIVDYKNVTSVIPGLRPWWDRGSQCQLENLWRDTQRTLMDYTSGESQWHSGKPPSKAHLSCRLHLPDRSMKRPHSAISVVTFSITSGSKLTWTITSSQRKPPLSTKKYVFPSQLTCCSCFNKFLSSILPQLHACVDGNQIQPHLVSSTYWLVQDRFHVVRHKNIQWSQNLTGAKAMAD